MKTILFLILFFITLNSYSQSYTISGIVYTDSVTLVKVEFSFGKWAVFMVDGNYVSDAGYVLSRGCVLRGRSAYLLFDSKLRYVTRKDKYYIEQSLNIQTLCSNDGNRNP